MNPHLNAFLPYERSAGHEDQLTRAAMVLMRLVPQVHDSFLRLVAGGRCLKDLGPGKFDMQTARVSEAKDFDELISVFLTPDDSSAAAESGDPIVEEPRRQRLDGVLRHSDVVDVVVVIETKLALGADDWQARRLDFGGAQPRKTGVVPLPWHKLIDRTYAVSASDE